MIDEEFSYLWSTEKDQWILAKVESDYCIINRIDQSMLLISDDDIKKQVIQKMIDSGNSVYESVLDLFPAHNKKGPRGEQ